MKCPRCGYIFNSNTYEVGFHPCTIDPDIIYVCDGCSKEVHVAYAEKRECLNLFSDNLRYGYPRYTYFCLDCMRNYGHFDELLEKDKYVSTEQAEYYLQEKQEGNNENRSRD